jgi:hypothetical protein
MLLRWVELILGLLIWLGTLWDGFATVVLPRTVAPMRRLSGRFYWLSWRLYTAVGRRIQQPDLRLSFLAVYGPLSVFLMLILWAALMIAAFALVYQGLGPRFQAAAGPVGFGTLFYMSASTFLTLGLGDVTSADPVGRLFVILEAGTGYIFLALIITYMPVLDQSYGSREAGNLLIHSRAGRPPSAIKFLSRYPDCERSEVLRGNLRDGERWMAEMLQSHLSHPVLAFYRAQHLDESWLTALATLLDSCALLIIGGEGLPAEQARLTYRMGLNLLRDLTKALGMTVDSRYRTRLTEADLPALIAAAKAARLTLTIEQGATLELVRLARRYDVYLVSLSTWLMIPLPSWIPLEEARQEVEALESPE